MLKSEAATVEFPHLLRLMQTALANRRNSRDIRIIGYACAASRFERLSYAYKSLHMFVSVLFAYYGCYSRLGWGAFYDLLLYKRVTATSIKKAAALIVTRTVVVTQTSAQKVRQFIAQMATVPSVTACAPFFSVFLL
jgi:hypothetical protein